eukprot:g9785.t1
MESTLEHCTFCEKRFQPGESFCQVEHDGKQVAFHLACFRCCRCRVGIGRGSYHLLPSLETAAAPEQAQKPGSSDSLAVQNPMAPKPSFKDIPFLCRACVPRCPACGDELLGSLTCFKGRCGEVKLHQGCFRCFHCTGVIQGSYSLLDASKITKQAKFRIDANIASDSSLHRLREKLVRAHVVHKKESSATSTTTTSQQQEDNIAAYSNCLVCEHCVGDVFPKRECYFCKGEIRHNCSTGVRSMTIDVAMRRARPVLESGAAGSPDRAVGAGDAPPPRAADDSSSGCRVAARPTEAQERNSLTTCDAEVDGVGGLPVFSTDANGDLTIERPSDVSPQFGPEWERLEVLQQIVEKLEEGMGIHPAEIKDKDTTSTQQSQENEPTIQARPNNENTSLLISNVAVPSEMKTVFFHGECFTCLQCKHPIQGAFLQLAACEFLCSECFPKCSACDESLVGRPSCTVGKLKLHDSCFKCCMCDVHLVNNDSLGRGVPECGTSASVGESGLGAAATVEVVAIVPSVPKVANFDATSPEDRGENLGVEVENGSGPREPLHGGHFAFDSSFFEESEASRKFFKQWQEKQRKTMQGRNVKTKNCSANFFSCPGCYRSLMQAKEDFVNEETEAAEFQTRRKLEAKHKIDRWDEGKLRGNSFECLQQLGVVGDAEVQDLFTEQIRQGGGWKINYHFSGGGTNVAPPHMPMPDSSANPMLRKTSYALAAAQTPALSSPREPHDNHAPKPSNLNFCVLFDAATESLSLSLVPPHLAEFGVNIHYLAESLRILQDNAEPFFSLDPADPTDLQGPYQKKRFHPEWLANTPLGEVLFQADYYLKQFSFGEVRGVPMLGASTSEQAGVGGGSSPASGYRESGQSRTRRTRHGSSRRELDQSFIASRQWFVMDRAHVVSIAAPKEISEEDAARLEEDPGWKPNKPSFSAGDFSSTEATDGASVENGTRTPDESSSSQFLLVPRVKLRVEARRLERDPVTKKYSDAPFTSASDPAVVQAQLFTEKFPTIAARVPVVAELVEVARALTLAKYILKTKNFAVMASVLERFSPQKVSEVVQFPVAEVDADRRCCAAGGVDFGVWGQAVRREAGPLASGKNDGAASGNDGAVRQGGAGDLVIRKDHLVGGTRNQPKIHHMSLDAAPVAQQEANAPQSRAPTPPSTCESSAVGCVDARGGFLAADHVEPVQSPTSSLRRPIPAAIPGRGSEAREHDSGSSSSEAGASSSTIAGSRKEPLSIVRNDPEALLKLVQTSHGLQKQIHNQHCNFIEMSEKDALARAGMKPLSRPESTTTTTTGRDEDVLSGSAAAWSLRSGNSGMHGRGREIPEPLWQHQANVGIGAPPPPDESGSLIRRRGGSARARADANLPKIGDKINSAAPQAQRNSASSSPDRRTRLLERHSYTTAAVHPTTSRAGVLRGGRGDQASLTASSSSFSNDTITRGAPGDREELQTRPPSAVVVLPAISRGDILRRAVEAQELEEMMLHGLRTSLHKEGAHRESRADGSSDSSESACEGEREGRGGGSARRADSSSKRGQGEESSITGSRTAGDPGRREGHDNAVKGKNRFFENDAADASISCEEHHSKHYPMFIPTLKKKTRASVVCFENDKLSVEQNTIHMYGGVDFAVPRIDEVEIHGVDFKVPRIDESEIQGVDLSISPERGVFTTSELRAPSPSIRSRGGGSGSPALRAGMEEGCSDAGEEDANGLSSLAINAKERKARIRLGWLAAPLENVIAEKSEELWTEFKKPQISLDLLLVCGGCSRRPVLIGTTGRRQHSPAVAGILCCFEQCGGKTLRNAQAASVHVRAIKNREAIAARAP